MRGPGDFPFRSARGPCVHGPPYPPPADALHEPAAAFKLVVCPTSTDHIAGQPPSFWSVLAAVPARCPRSHSCVICATRAGSPSIGGPGEEDRRDSG